MAKITLHMDEGTGYNYEKYQSTFVGYDKNGNLNDVYLLDNYPQHALSSTEFSTLWVLKKRSSIWIPDYYYKTTFTGSGFKATARGGMGDLHANVGTITGIEFRNNNVASGGPVITIEDISYNLISTTYYTENKDKYDGVTNPSPISLSYIPGELVAKNQTLLFYDDEIIGSEGGDAFKGFNGNDTMIGKGGDDHLKGNIGEDSITGNAGLDTLFGGKGKDTIRGGKGNDEIKANNNDDLIYGDKDDDLIRGGKDNDTIYGGIGNDTIYGDKGNDELWGDDDNIYGNKGADIFRFRPGDGNNFINDFNPDAGDRIQIKRGLDYEYIYTDTRNIIEFSDGGYVMIGGLYAANIDSFIYIADF